MDPCFVVSCSVFIDLLCTHLGVHAMVSTKDIAVGMAKRPLSAQQDYEPSDIPL